MYRRYLRYTKVILQYTLQANPSALSFWSESVDHLGPGGLTLLTRCAIGHLFRYRLATRLIFL